jgi:hypothetical protein
MNDKGRSLNSGEEPTGRNLQGSKVVALTVTVQHGRQHRWLQLAKGHDLTDEHGGSQAKRGT